MTAEVWAMVFVVIFFGFAEFLIVCCWAEIVSCIQANAVGCIQDLRFWGVPKRMYLCHSLRYADKINHSVWALNRVSPVFPANSVRYTHASPLYSLGYLISNV